ncbi:hypothetical protein FRB95_014071 [Tulasnella sp. JGI-2019a]|nr:hypothetical protein FRB95_014071 [Tulasnella sp. JGI-2019a]
MEEHEDPTSTQRHRDIENDNGIGTDPGSGNNDHQERYDNAGTLPGEAAVIFNELDDQRMVVDPVRLTENMNKNMTAPNSATAKTPLDVTGLKSLASHFH